MVKILEFGDGGFLDNYWKTSIINQKYFYKIVKKINSKLEFIDYIRGFGPDMLLNEKRDVEPAHRIFLKICKFARKIKLMDDINNNAFNIHISNF